MARALGGRNDVNVECISGKLEDEVREYRKLLELRIRNHQAFSRLTALTAIGLLASGVVILVYFPSLGSLGWLMIIFSTLRMLNSIYDLQREEEISTRMRILDQRFGRHELA